MPVKIEAIPGDRLTLGESPHWDAESKTLYFPDAHGNALHRYIPATNEHTKVNLEKRSSFIISVEGEKDQFVISYGREIVLISWRRNSDKITILETLASLDEISDKKNLNINDAKADFTGRLWFGTFAAYAWPPENGAGGVYSLEEDGIKPRIEKTTASNGLTWNTSLGKFYFIDSMKRTVDQYDFDLKTRTVSNPQAIFTLSKHNIDGIADGMTIDSDGNLWVSIIQGKQVIKIDPRKPETLLEKIELPVELVTCAEFGGENLDELYVTTGRITVLDKNYDGEYDGTTYKITGTGAHGVLSNKFKLLKRH